MIFRKIKILFNIIGWDINKTKNIIVGLPSYYNDFKELKRQKRGDEIFDFVNPIPILDEKNEEAGAMSGQYFHQDLFVAQKIYENKPLKHIDIGSRIDGFVAHVASFREIEIFDIRNIKKKIKNIIFKQADITKRQDDIINYCDSISCLHVIEHIGLGRYGDPIDYYGHEKALDNIYQILRKGGKFYLSTPIGRSSIQFNAHRIFSLKYLINLLNEKYKIDNISYVNDQGELIKNIELTKELINKNLNCSHGLIILEMTKI